MDNRLSASDSERRAGPLDSDAVVLRRLDWILDLLDEHEFVGFNDGGLLEKSHPWGVRVNCFAPAHTIRLVGDRNGPSSSNLLRPEGSREDAPVRVAG